MVMLIWCTGAKTQQCIIYYNYRINLYYRACLSIVFPPIIEKELEEYMAYWNSHCIRSSRGDCLGGIPNDLFDMPAYYGKAIEAA